jgi:hypothetical protein
MSPIRRYLSMAMGALSLLILGYIVAVAARSRPGTTTDDSLFEINSALDFDATRILAWIILAMATLGAVLFALGLTQRKPREDQKKRSLLGLIIGVVAFLLIVRYVQPLTQTFLEGSDPAEAAETLDQAPSDSSGSSGWLFSLLLAAVVAAALTRVGVSVRSAEAPFDTLEDPAVQEASIHARSPESIPAQLGDDPRSRVLAAYSRFEEDANATGVVRKSTETAGQHARRSSRDLGLDPAAVEGLTTSYSRTRFGFGEITQDEASAAERLSAELRQGMRR